VRDDHIFYPTHGAPVAAPRAWLRGLLGHRRMREAQILTALAQDGSVPMLVQRLYPGLDAGLRGAAAAQVSAHLLKLEKEGRAVSQGGRWLRSRRPGRS
jgi:hypothetical protein